MKLLNYQRNLQQFFDQINYEEYIQKLNPPDIDRLLEQSSRFTSKDVFQVNQAIPILLGENGIKTIVDVVSNEMASLKTNESTSILNVGSAIHVFLNPITQKIRNMLPNPKFFALDVTPAILISLVSSVPDIMPIVGVTENILESVKENQKFMNIPDKFDGIFSILLLHHCPSVDRAISNFYDALNPGGKAIVLDLCKHEFPEVFHEEEEMLDHPFADRHPGFELDMISDVAKNYFSTVEVKRLEGIKLTSDGKSTDLFLAIMKKD